MFNKQLLLFNPLRPLSAAKIATANHVPLYTGALYIGTKKHKSYKTMKKFFAVLLVFISFAILRAQPVVEGDWGGGIKIMGQELEIVTHFKQGDAGISGTIDIPPQGAYGLKLSNFIHLHPDFSFELNVPNGLAKFDGHFSGDSLTGKFLQAGIEGMFYLTRSAPVTPKKETEETKEKLPYKEEEVSFKNGENTFSGTLTVPEYQGKHPAVVMITGSGAQNRDEELFGFKPFRIIADHLTRNGIAVLRYDDRGTGKSTGKKVSESTTEEFAYDVIEAVKYLQTRKDINPGQVGLIGHSEGGVVGPLAASKYGDVAFVVCIAGTGVNGEEIIMEQTKLIELANKTPEEVVREDQIIMKKMLKLLMSDEDKKWVIDTLKNIQLSEYEKLSEEQKKEIKDKNEWAESYAKSVISQFDNPWMKYFLRYDPAPALEKTKCPVLLLFGELDLQVAPSQNLEPMKKALEKGGNKDFEIKIFPKANHLFQEAVTGSPNEYATLEKKFINGFLDHISGWILKRVTISR